MAKETLTPEQKLKRENKNLRKEIAIHKAFRLNVYADPQPLDVTAALAESKDKTRFGQKYIQAWYIGDSAAPLRTTILSTSRVNHSFVYATELAAMIAFRNKLALETAEQLAELDISIDRLLEHNIDAAAPAEPPEQSSSPLESLAAVAEDVASVSQPAASEEDGASSFVDPLSEDEAPAVEQPEAPSPAQPSETVTACVRETPAPRKRSSRAAAPGAAPKKAATKTTRKAK